MYIGLSIQIMNCMLLFLGASITACRASGRHIVAIEQDKEIFEAILLPMKNTLLPVETVQVAEPRPVIQASQDPDAMVIVPRSVV